MSACSSDTISKPPLKEPKDTYVQHESIIQIPISIDTKEIQRIILAEVKHPLSTGVTKKITTDIFAAKKISKKELIEAYGKTSGNLLKPFEATYQYVSKDIAKVIDSTFKAGVWVKHEVYLKKLEIFFEGSQVQIYTTYEIDLSVDYEQSAIPLGDAIKIKGILDGKIEANIALRGNISINDNAQLQIDASQENTKVTFTKISIPSSLNLLDILKATNTENFLTKKLLEEPVNRYVFNQIQAQISKKQIDINLAQKILELVYEHSHPLLVSKDLWLVPQASSVSISQVDGQGGICTNTLSINVGITAKPKLITSLTQPKIKPLKPIPITCEPFSPKIHLYPTFNIEYDFAGNKLKQELQKLLDKKYADSEYLVKDIEIYPSDAKLVLAIALVEKGDPTETIDFYLWGTPKLHPKEMYINLEDLDYTIESKSHLLSMAGWLLDDEVKNLIQEKTNFVYKEKFLKLSQKLSNIEHTSGKKIITGHINLLGIENIHISKSALVIHLEATGNLSYKMNLYK